MPTFAAIQFDRFLEPGASKTTSSTNILDVSRNTTSLPVLKSSSRRKDIPPTHPQLRRLNSTSSPATPPPPSARPQIHPSLYATPEPTPIPDSATSSFPPSSPFLINHKRRGPRLLKSLSDQSVVAEAAVALEGGHVRSHSEENVSIEAKIEKFDDELVVNGLNDDGLVAEIEAEKAEVNGDVLVRENCESEDFYDPQESLSFSASADSEDYGGERSARGNTPMGGGEFYDAWEELSSDSGLQAQRSLNEVEIELREMRLTLLMEIEKRKLSEEALQNMEQLWRMLREKLGAVGLTLPENLNALTEDGQADTAPIEEICRQIQMARFVSESIGRGIAKAEAEAVMEAQLEMKNFEIARLTDRLHYYETMNREMSQRNQEAMEIARHERQKKRIRQKWVWGSIIVPAAVTLGGAALAWSLLPSGSGKWSSSSECNRAFQPNSDKQ